VNGDSRTNVADTIGRALALHQSGRLTEAEQLYRTVLGTEPTHFEALHFLGLVEAQRQNFVEADRLMSRSLAVKSDTADAHANHARVLNALKRYADAVAACDKALSINPRLASALVSKGNAFQALERDIDALASYEAALAVNPGVASVWSNRANTLWKLGRREDAVGSYQKALSLAPGLREALVGYGNALRELDRHQEALACYDRALALKPDDVALLVSRAQVLGLARRVEESLASCDRALALEPDDMMALITRGDALTTLHRPIEALEAYGRALAVNPDSALALNNRSNALQGINRYDEALADLERAQRLVPDYADAHLNEALVRFCLGDFRRAWEKYEWRWKCRYWPERPRGFTQPLWLGQESLQGRSILLHAEQGLGDTLHFLRYVAPVVARGAEVVLEVQGPLKTLASQIEGVARVVARGDALPASDFHCPLLSLPLACGPDEDSIPRSVPYLWPPRDWMAKWQARLPAGRALRVGLVWSGNPDNPVDAIRSIGFSRLLPLLDLPGVEFLCIQKDIRQDDGALLRQRPTVTNLAAELHDFADTAAAIMQLDLVIAVETSVAHLVGALGKPLWVLLPFSPGWRWMLDRDDSPWYPSARLFRQPAMGDWDSVVARVQPELAALAVTHRDASARMSIGS
jgi:tetratricopeptide (TPR) repeat protein